MIITNVMLLSISSDVLTALIRRMFARRSERRLLIPLKQIIMPLVFHSKGICSILQSLVTVNIYITQYRRITFCMSFSPILFNVYMDDLSVSLNSSNIGGRMGNIFLNHLCYADDLCLISLSSAGM